MEVISGSVDGNLFASLRQYESEFSEFKQDVSILQMQNREYLKTVKIVTDENNKLHEEIQRLAEEQITKNLGDRSGWNNEETIQNLQSQLDLARQERDAAINMNKETTQLLDNIRLEKFNQVHNNRAKGLMNDETRFQLKSLEEANLQLQILVESLQQENKSLSYASSKQITELQSSQEANRDLKKKLVESTKKFEESSNSVAVLSTRLEDKEKKLLELKQKNEDLLLENQKLESSMVEAEDKLTRALEDVSSFQTKVDELKVQNLALENLNRGIEAKEMNYLMQIRESAQLLDDALLSRDSAVSKQQKVQEDLDKASASMEALVQEMANRVGCEVDKVKISCNVKIRKLMDEIELLELENTNLRSEADRARRDKKSAEEELDIVQQQRVDYQDQMQIENIQRRAIHAENARDDLLIVTQKLEEKLKHLVLESEEEKKQLVKVNQMLVQRIQTLERENEENDHKKLQLLELLNQHKNENQKLKEYSQSARLLASKEFSAAQHNLMKEKKQLEVKLSCVEGNHHVSLRNLHKMLADQQRIVARWRDESKHMSNAYEDKVKTLESQLSVSKKRCQELVNKLKYLPSSATEDIFKLKESNRKLKAELHQSQYRTLTLLNTNKHLTESTINNSGSHSLN